MSRLDLYLQRIFTENELYYEEDLYYLYDFTGSESLRKVLAAFHTLLNKWFETINSDIRTGYDENGNVVYQGGRFHAQDSRDFLKVVELIDKARSQLSNTEYAFRVCDAYDDALRRTKRFVVKSGGSSIPEGFLPIDIKEITPAFELLKNIALTKGNCIVYKELKSIGEGSYAKVFSYIDPTYGFPVALKRANKNLDNKELNRFKQEFEVLKKLSSPYIVQVYYYDNEKNEYTMECMDESIYKYISRENTNLTLTKRKGLIMQVCNALKYIHSKDILHRDISLLNVFIKHYEDRDVVKLGDFGLVKMPESNMTSLMTEFKGSLNDPDLKRVGFLSYEMCHETYALTQLCFYILTGKTNPNRQNDGLIKRFWMKGTHPNREERFQNVDEVLNAIGFINDENQ